MCICAKPTHLSDTQIFTCVCGVDKGSPTRQFVVYQNKVTFTDEGVSENLMCLPVPLKTGLEPKDHILLYDFSEHGKGDLSRKYKEFFANVDYGFKMISRSKPMFNSLSKEAKPKHLEVIQVGGYQCSLASTPADVLRLDPAVFGEPVGMREVLEKNYPVDFAFLICRFKRDAKLKIMDLHPIAYSHPIASDHKLFIPTRHYHGSGKPNESWVDDWDHNVYIFGADVKSVEEVIKTAKYNRGRSYINGPINKFNASVTDVLQNLFTQHGAKDSFEPAKLFTAEKSCKLHIHGTFDNLDFQPTVHV